MLFMFCLLVCLLSFTKFVSIYTYSVTGTKLAVKYYIILLCLLSVSTYSV